MFKEIDKNKLADIQNIQIDCSKNRLERFEEFLISIQDPYCFLCNNTVVSLSFSDDAVSFQDAMHQYLLNKDNDYE